MEKLTRRDFLVMSGTTGVALSTIGVNLAPLKAYAAGLTKMDRVKNAKQIASICCYCSVGCGILGSVDSLTGKIINVEGDPEHPINEGSLCSKGAGLFGISEANGHRLKKVLYRAPRSDRWEEKDLSWAIKRIARLIKDMRDKDFITHNDKNQLVNRVETIGHLGTSNINNEECWVMSVACRAMGLVYIDHQARV